MTRDRRPIPVIPLVYIVLLVNVIAVLAMPPALLFLYLLVNDREIVGDLVGAQWPMPSR